jgi:WD40 repeat protein
MTFPPLPGFISGTRITEPDYVLMGTPYVNTSTTQPFALAIRGAQVTGVVVSPDNSLILGPEFTVAPNGHWLVGRRDGFQPATIMSINRLEFRATQQLSGVVRPNGFAFSNDSTLLALADNGWVRELDGNNVWQVTGTFMFPDGTTPRASYAVFHPDDDSLLIASPTGSPRNWAVWSRDGQDWIWRQTVLRDRLTTRCLAFHPTEGLLVETGELTVNTQWLKCWDRSGNFYVDATGIANINLGGGATSPQWSPDGNYLAVRGGTQRLWLWSYAARAFTLIPAAQLLPATAVVNSISFSPDSQLLAVAHTEEPYLTIINVGPEPSVSISPPSPPLPSPYTRVRFHPAYPVVEV